MNPIVIIGGGAIGMLTALELARADVTVTLFDRQDTGRESSWAGGGIVSPLFPWRYLDAVTHLASWSQSAYPDLCGELAEATGIDPELTQNGMLVVAPDEADAALDWAAQHGRQVEIVDAETFAALEPQAAHPLDGALWMPDVAQVRNPRIVRALRTRLEQLGVTIRTDDAVEGLVIEGGRCRGIVSRSGRQPAEQVVVCAGAWSRGLLGAWPHPPEIHPKRGQMLLFRAEPGTISRIVLEGSRYVIPRRDGRTLFGSTIEDAGFAKQTTDAARDELYAIATERFPVLKDCPIETHWAGLRPSSPAGVPFIGRHPEIDGLFVNAGHFRNGIVLGPASARLAADLVLERSPVVDPAPYGWTAARG
jgi:glycine oxidase